MGMNKWQGRLFISMSCLTY